MDEPQAPQQNAPQQNALLELRHVSKSFPGVKALDDVSFDVRAGEVMGLLGENGAGKSTILKIISGAQRPDEGEIVWNGAALHLHRPQEAHQVGIVTIYQEFNLVPTLSVAENIFIGRHPRAGGFVDWRAMTAAARKITDRIGLPIDPATEVSSLSVAQQQMVEIARALSMQAKLIIMDEPTAALSQAEVSLLIDIVRRLRAEGVAILFVTHRLEEVMAICDRVTVLRDGRLAGRMDRAGLTIPTIIETMVGRAASDLYRRPERRHPAGAVRLSVRGLSTRRDGSRLKTPLTDVSLDVRAGEILGLAGLVGAGRTELARAIFGVDPIAAGEITLDGRPYRPHSPRDAIRQGIGLVPEDRKKQALFLQLAIRPNFSITAIGRFLKAGIFVDETREGEALEAFRGQLKVKMTGPEQRVAVLSGGNQQKIVLARWLALGPKVLIVDEPTRGIDIAAKSEVHELLGALAERGIAIIVISSELPEVMAVADRVVTLAEGRVTGELMANELTETRLMERMTPRSSAEPASGPKELAS